MGLLDGDLGLRLDRGAGLVLRVVQVQARGVDDGELAPAPVRDAIEAIAGETRLRVDDRLTPAENPVEKRRLPNIWASDDRDDWASHPSIRPGSANSRTVDLPAGRGGMAKRWRGPGGGVRHARPGDGGSDDL